MRVSVIANPISGRSGRHNLLPRFLAPLSKAGLDVAVEETEGPGHAVELAAAACRDGAGVVVAVGGDGTVNEVLNGLALPGPALATFPLGTSSILARELRIPFAPEEAAKVVLANRRRRMDVGSVNGRRFLMVVGIGWDAEVVDRVTRSRKGHMGKHSYFLPIARTVAEYSFPELSVELGNGNGNGKARRKAKIVFVCNTRNYAAFFRVAPKAVPDDGLLDFVLMRDGAARDYVRWAVAAFTGSLPRYRDVDYVQGKTIAVESETPVPFQIDGDPGGTTPLSISVEPSALEVVVP